MKKRAVATIVAFAILSFWACEVPALPDATPPTSGGEMGFSDISFATMTVSWDEATDDVTPPSSLRYKLVKAADPELIDTAGDADAVTGADLVMDWTAAALTCPVTGLTPATTYYFTVLVWDAAGNKIAYAPHSVTSFAGYNLTVNTDFPAWAPNGYAYVYINDFASGSTITSNSGYLDASGYISFTFNGIPDTESASQQIVIQLYDHDWNFLGNYTKTLTGLLYGYIGYTVHDGGVFTQN